MEFEPTTYSRPPQVIPGCHFPNLGVITGYEAADGYMATE